MVSLILGTYGNSTGRSLVVPPAHIALCLDSLHYWYWPPLRCLALSPLCPPPKARHASRALPEHSTPTSAVLRKPSAPGAMQGAISLLTSMANSSPAPSAKLALSPIPLGNRHAVPVLSANMQRQMAKQSATHVPSANPIHSRARPRQVSRVSPSHSACLMQCMFAWMAPLVMIVLRWAGACVACTKGKAASAAGLATCTKCIKGKFSSSGAKCWPCPTGTYSDTDGSASCTSCPDGTFNSGTSGTSKSECTKCDAGTYDPGQGRPCAKCLAGTFTASSGANVCSACPSGTYAALQGQTVCTKCIAGKANSHAQQGSAGACVACSKGSIAAASGSAQCSKCTAGKYTEGAGSTVCTQCPAGKWSAQAGADGVSSCQTCPKGKTSSQTGLTAASDCIGCPKGKFSASGGACVTCTSGTYSDTLGRCPELFETFYCTAFFS